MFQTKKLKDEVNELRKSISADMIALRFELSFQFDEHKAEELYTLEGEYKSIMEDPDNYETCVF